MSWYKHFETKLNQIYTFVKYKTGNLTVGGSAAIAYMLAHLNMLAELNDMIPPSDLDFMYNNSQISHPNFDNFTKSTESLEKSITYTNVEGVTFDLIFVPDKSPINNINLDGIDVLNPKTLRSFYRDNLDGFDESRNRAKDEQRLRLLNAIISKIESDSKLSARFFPDKPRKRRVILDESESDMLAHLDSEEKTTKQLFGSPQKVRAEAEEFNSSPRIPSSFVPEEFNSPPRIPYSFASEESNSPTNGFPIAPIGFPRTPIIEREPSFGSEEFNSQTNGFPIAPIGFSRTPMGKRVPRPEELSTCDYKSKYIKYKTKYLNLAKKLNKV